MTNSDYVDKSTLALKVIDYEHHEVHDERHFFIEDFLVLDNDEVLDIVFQTANIERLVHMLVDVGSKAELEYEVFQDANVTFDGTPITIRNNYLESDNLSTVLQVQKNPTIISTGTRLGGISLGSSTNPNQGIPGNCGIGRGREKVLKRNSIYIFRFTSRLDSNTTSYDFGWYEHIKKGD